MANNKYKPSGKAPFFGVIGMILFGLIGALVLLTGYLYGMNLMPNMGLRILVFIGVLILLSGWMHGLVKTGRIRSPGKAFWLSFFLILIDLYAACILYVVLVHDAWEFPRAEFWKEHITLETPKKWLYLLLHPVKLKDSMITIMKEGFFTVRGTKIAGVPLLIMWIVEVLLFLLIPSFRAMSQGYKIFSEKHRRWLNQTAEFTCNYIKDHRTLRRQLIKGDTSGLDEIHYYKVQGQEAHGTITFHHHRGKVSPFVSMQMVKAVQIGPRRIKHFYIPILEQWDLGEAKEEEIFERLLEESGLTREKVTGRGNYKERLFWRSKKEQIRGTIKERVEKTNNRVQVRDSGTYKHGDEVEGLNEATVYAPVITSEMEQEYLEKKKREEQEREWAENREEIRNRKNKSKRRSTRIK